MRKRTKTEGQETVTAVNCVIAGFPGAGKKSLLASLVRASVSVEKAEQLRAYADEATTLILHDAMLGLFGSSETPVPPVAHLSVEIKMELGNVRKRRFHGTFTLLDLPPPGNLDGPSRWMSAHALVESALQSDVLIWLIDSTNPQLHDIMTLIRGVRAQLREHPFLPVGRLLLLASKFDVLLDRRPELNGNQPANWAGGYVDRALERELRHKEPHEMLMWIEPAAQIKDLLGAACIREITACFSPDALVASGVVSPRGFSTSYRSNVIIMSGDEIELAWTPYGVLDMVRFSLAGIARGQVSAISEEMRNS